MKKTNAIHLVLITAAMAACNRPLYQQRPDGYEDPGYSTGASAGALTAGPAGGTPGGIADAGLPADYADSTNSCPVESSALPPDYYDWYNGAGTFLSFNVDININGFYASRSPAPLVRVNPFRSLFTRTFGNIPAAVHRMATNALAMAPHPMENHPAAARNIPASTHPTVARSGFGARVGAAAHS
jgi:hypothetical protein